MIQIIIGPHTFIYIKLNNFLNLSLFLKKKDVLIILINK
jgi:hypothetical protein